MKMVIDCSAAVEMARHTEKGDELRSLLAMHGSSRVVAPDLIFAEVGSAMTKYVRAELTNEAEARAIIADALDLVDEFTDVEALYEEAFSESLRLNHSIYDMFYFVLARRNGATLLTLDKGLHALCEREGVSCIHTVRIPDGLIEEVAEAMRGQTASAGKGTRGDESQSEDARGGSV